MLRAVRGKAEAPLDVTVRDAGLSAALAITASEEEDGATGAGSLSGPFAVKTAAKAAAARPLPGPTAGAGELLASVRSLPGQGNAAKMPAERACDWAVGVLRAFELALSSGGPMLRRMAEETALASLGTEQALGTVLGPGALIGKIMREKAGKS